MNYTQRELIDKFLGMLGSVDNDYNQEQVTDFQEELEKIQNELCESCGDNGTFFFTKDNKLEDSQPCGKCNKKVQDAVILQQESKQAIEIVKRLKEWIKNYGFEDYVKRELQSILKGEKK